MTEGFIPTHRAKTDRPPEAKIVIYDPAAGHIAVAPADGVEKLIDGRDGTLLQGQEKSPVPVYKGYAIVEYDGYIYATMPASDVSAWFEQIPGDLKIPALPKKAGKSLGDELKDSE